MTKLLYLLLDWLVTRLPKLVGEFFDVWAQKRASKKRAQQNADKLREAKTEEERKAALDDISDSFSN